MKRNSFFSCSGAAFRPHSSSPRHPHVQRGVLFIFSAMALACSTLANTETGGGGGSGGTGGPPPAATDDGADEGSGDDATPILPQDGDQCGESVPLGWETECQVFHTLREYTNPLMQTVVEVEDEFTGFNSLCCEGQPSLAEASAGCHELCRRQLCFEARDTHLWWTVEAAPGCWDGTDPYCGFDMEACMTGTVHEQVIDDPDDELEPVDYFLEVSCNTANLSDRQANGAWSWIQFPNNDPDDDPPTCSSPEEMGNAPGARSDSFSASDSAGTYATLTWDFGEIGGIEASDALSVDLGYRLTPCREGKSLCIELTRLDISASDIVAQGLELSQAHLSLEEIPASTIEVVAGHFTVPGGALQFRLSATVDGSPLTLFGSNDGPMAGHIREGGLTLSGLRFSYADALFAATVQIEVESAHYASKPRSTISVLEAPLDCHEPVIFSVETDELDGEAVSYQWWLPPLTLGDSATFEAVLAPGSHSVLLMTRDASGRTDATAMSYRRSCR